MLIKNEKIGYLRRIHFEILEVSHAEQANSLLLMEHNANSMLLIHRCRTIQSFYDFFSFLVNTNEPFKF